MTYLAASLAVMGFVVALERLGVAKVAAEAVQMSREAASVIRDGSLSDEEKERSVRAASASLGMGFLSIGLRSVIAAALFVLILLAFDLPGGVSLGSATDWLATWEGMGAMTVLVLAWVTFKRLR